MRTLDAIRRLRFTEHVPAFDLWPGRPIAFDTILTNDAPIKLDIALARNTTTTAAI